jgi:protein-S-isoprenylcysteine O-methyltransferase Ste14
VRDTFALAALNAIFWFGWALVLASTFLISHFELFGLSQVFARALGTKSSEPRFSAPLFYRYVRHPLYLGFLLAFWAAPSMSVGHLLFSAATTSYIMIAIQLEERDLISLFGDQYRRYRMQVSMLFPIPHRIISRAGSAQGAPTPRSH